jgi:hypothetical protein
MGTWHCFAQSAPQVVAAARFSTFRVERVYASRGGKYPYIASTSIYLRASLRLIHIPYVKSFHKLIVIMLMYSWGPSMSFVISTAKTIFNMGKKEFQAL